MRTIPLAVLVTLLAVIVSSRVARGDDGAVVSRKLSNGLIVHVEVDRRRPRVGIAMGYEVGSRDDPRGLSGLAHLTEHLMFTGSAHVDEGGHHARLEEVGATSIGGTTKLDRTLYFEEVPRGAWRRALWLERDRLAYLLVTLDEARLDREREVVRNEWRLKSGHGRITDRSRAIYELLYPPSHPYHRPRAILETGTLKPPSDIDRIGLTDVQWFFQRHYRPSRATLAVVGDVDAAEVVAEAERLLGSVRTVGEDPARPTAPRWTRTTERVGTMSVLDPRSGLVAGWALPPPEHADHPALALLADHLESRDGPLYGVLRERRLLDGLRAFVVPSELGSLFVIDVVGPKGANGGPVIDAIGRAVRALQRDGLDEDRTQHLIRRASVRLAQRSERLVARAVHLAERGEPLVRARERIRVLRASDLQRAATRWLVPGHRAILTFTPARTAGAAGRLEVRR